MANRSGVHVLLAGSLVLVASAIPVVVRAVVPVDGGPLVLFPVAIHTGSGDQYHAHVDGDLASYADGSTIRYYNFLTGEDDVVPLPVGATDFLNDVSAGRISFTRIEPSGRLPILVYDVATGQTTELDPQPSPTRFWPSIGSNTVAFIDQVTVGGEIFAADLAGVGATRVTTDTRIDQAPSVSPLGDVIVWESCEVSAANCDIHRATWSGVSWVIAPVTATAEPEASPHTDGIVIVYEATRAGERDIYWQPVGGGPEQHLELPGFQRGPSVSGGVVTFEGEIPGDTAADLFAYHIATNKLYRITSTQGLDEELNDVAVLPDGRVRVVWNSGVEPSRDVIGATFELPCDHLTWYRDADGDFRGNPSDSVLACTQPPGYTDGAGDCDDSNPATYPYAVEVKDGADNQCPGDCSGCGYGVVDEITGPTGWDGTVFYWPPQSGAESYQMVRSPVASFTSACFVFASTSASAIADPSNPSLGTAYFYLVRSLSPPPPGSWGQRSSGAERIGGCLPP